jgi:NAD(P)-dependent dehydrogenase (short-subunit alcohol dehydrogenase family)
MTGGNRGIGLAVLKKLLQCEMTVVCAVRNPEGCREIVEKAFDESLYKGKIFYEKCDTSDMETVKEFVKKVREKFPSIHLLINNGEL